MKCGYSLSRGIIRHSRERRNKMGFPRSNEGYRLYQEKAMKSFLMIIMENGKNGSGSWDAIANVYGGSTPSLCSTGASPDYLKNCCRRVQWSDLPEEWKRAFLAYMTEKPEDIRGLWHVG
jgi:hypothetical protein